MLKIEIFGAGCPKCKKTEELFIKTLSDMKIAADLSHIKDMNEMIKRGIMFTPAIFINDKKVIEGRVPTEAEVAKLIKEAQK